MTIRILCIVITLIVAVWVSREVNLSGGWTVIFTLLASAAVGFMAIIIPLNYEGYVTTAKSYETRVVSRYLAERTKPPVMLATIVPVVTPVRTGYGQITTFLCIMESPILWYSQYQILTMEHYLRVRKLP